MKDIRLITLEELEEIRRLWVVEKHEIEDSLPRIYMEETGEAYPGGRVDDAMMLSESDVDVLRTICGDDQLHFQLVRELLSVERKHRVMVRRSGIYREIEEAIRRGFFDSEDDAFNHALSRQRAKDGELPLDATLNVSPDDTTADQDAEVCSSIN
jgi:DNA sulfur modification protein DndC